MGITRKMLSTVTLGAVDFRSDKERIAAYTRGARRAARRQVRLLRRQNRLLAEQLPTPAGWYPDQRVGWLRWWDGTGWTEHVHPNT